MYQDIKEQKQNWLCQRLFILNSSCEENIMYVQLIFLLIVGLLSLLEYFVYFILKGVSSFNLWINQILQVGIQCSSLVKMQKATIYRNLRDIKGNQTKECWRNEVGPEKFTWENKLSICLKYVPTIKWKPFNNFGRFKVS